MSLSAASKCPFLSGVSKSFLQHSGTSMNMYGQKCPVMSRMFHVGASSIKNTGRKNVSLGK